MGKRPPLSLTPANTTSSAGSTPPLHRRGPADPAALNRSWLAAYACAAEAHARLHWRNALAAANLPLVRQQAGRLRHCTDLPLDDLVQIGAIGLLRAIEAYDARHNARLSSFAVPYIRGAMLRHLRDHHCPLRAPRRLRELQRKAEAMQAQRRHAGLPPLGSSELARQLGCGVALLEEAAGLRQAERLRSLDTPLAPGDGEGPGGTLIDELAARPPEATPTEKIAPPLQWLRQRLAELTAQERELLEGRHRLGATWVELGERLGLHPRLAQRRAEALLERLRREAADAGLTLSRA
ncbi:MAG: sigma-70 family RNA polymerase sigma factor [Prochlorococcaceae cyanobacterium]|jgi:RNA polymerase sigma-B factor